MCCKKLIYSVSFVLVILCALSFVTVEPLTAKQQAEQILKTCGVKGGLIVYIGRADAEFIVSLHTNDRYIVHGLIIDESEKIDEARKSIRAKGLYGPVSVSVWNGEHLPYVDNLVNCLVIQDTGCKIQDEEIKRVLAPRGVAVVKDKALILSTMNPQPLTIGNWFAYRKPVPPDIDEWTHFLHGPDNNAVSHDNVVGPPKHLQWTAPPLYCRSHEIDSSISACVSGKGRVFYILDEGLIGLTDERLPESWSLIARDAFNGVLLWKKPVSPWGWPQWAKEKLQGKDWTTIGGLRTQSPAPLSRCLVVNEDKVYVTLGYRSPLTILDAATGSVLKTCSGTDGTDEILCSDGIILVRVENLGKQKSRAGTQVAEAIIALDADTGEVLWKKEAGGIIPLTLAVQNKHVVFMNGKEIVCMDLDSGNEQWRIPRKDQKKVTLVLHDSVVLVRSGKNVEVFRLSDGKALWKKPFGGARSEDLLVADGLVWTGYTRPGLINDPKSFWDQPFNRPRSPQSGVHMDGLDPLTGDISKSIDIINLVSPGHHFRCYRSKATDRYIIWPKRGVEFIDLKADNHMRNDWIRGPCKYGVMPCNGLLYVPPNQCFCYTGVNFRGFNALSKERETKVESLKSNVERLVKGPAYEKVIGNRKSEIKIFFDWSTYRSDYMRRGYAPVDISESLKPSWSVAIGGKLTQAVSAKGKVFLASVDEHTVYALNAESGKQEWIYIAGGRVDSPPTIHQGLVLFGCADGWVYCLRASDGKLAWRYHVTPVERCVVAFNQLESARPVHGAVLVLDNIIYAAAGRSTYLDGGIHVCALEPAKGTLLHEVILDGPHPDLSKDIGRPFNAKGANSDVLVTDGKDIFIGQIALDKNLKEKELPRVTNMGDRKFGRHIFSTAGFLDDNNFNRNFWMYCERWPGYYIANHAPKSGQLLVYDDKKTYGIKYFTRRNIHSPMFFPEENGYLLFADNNETEPILYGEPGVPEPVKWLPEVSGQGYPGLGVSGQEYIQLRTKTVDRDKSTGFTRCKPPVWTSWVPIRVRAMVAVREKLFIAGPPDVIDPADPMAAFEARKGAVLRGVSTRNGSKIFEYKLDSPPVWDGMMAADNRLYLSLMDGKIVCFE